MFFILSGAPKKDVIDELMELDINNVIANEIASKNNYDDLNTSSFNIDEI